MLKEDYTPSQWVTGSDQPQTTTCWVAKSVTVEQYAPMAQLTSSGEFVLWNPTTSNGSQNATHIAPFAFTTGSASAETKGLIKSGTFNPELVAWPSGTTETQKRLAFVGTPISLQAPVN